MILAKFHHVEIMVTSTHSSTANVSMDHTLCRRSLLVQVFGLTGLDSALAGLHFGLWVILIGPTLVHGDHYLQNVWLHTS